MGFGLKVKRVPAGERQRRVQEALSLVQLPNLAVVDPPSFGWAAAAGGFASSSVNEPAVLLLDEPLARWI
ncbi:MAG: hypothetical protein H6658_12985 [Ardenticatenaceae bacterium]|nr:hypothetical protein [Ardenticatenaceae bacterium]